MERPAIPPKKRQKLQASLDEYMANRARDPFADPPPAIDTNPGAPRSRAAPVELGSPIQQLATLGMQFASTGQPNPSHSSPFASLGSSPHSLLSSNTVGSGNTLTPGLIEDDSDWATINDHSDTDLLLEDGFNDLEMIDADKELNHAHPRHFDSSRPIHTFSRQELVDMKMAAHFLRSLGFDSDAFELFTILLKQLKESNSQPSWRTKAALIHCARSSCQSQQVDIARTELFKYLEEPRESSTDAEHFLYRMLLAETYSRSNEEENEKFLRDIAIGCELANDRMLDRLPEDHRSYDILTYHYLNKCLEYLNSLKEDSLEENTWDKGTIFTDKEHLQIRTVERIPGPFELRYGKMQNPCLRSCLDWCLRVLRSNILLPDGWPTLQSDGRHYLYWVDHIGLYCAFWERWQSQRRDCLGAALPRWMLETEARMGIHPAELLSIVCGMIMSAAPPRLRSDADLIVRARTGVRTVCQMSDKDLGCQFLETYSLLRALIGSRPQRQYHDFATFLATLVNHGREREAFKGKACIFARRFIEDDLNIILPEVQEDTESEEHQNGTRLGLLLSENARLSMESLSAWFPTLGGTSEHSSELSAMRRLRDQIEQAAQAARRKSIDRTSAPPSNVFDRLASRSQASLPSMCELSRMTSSLSLSPSMENANSYWDNLAAATRDLFQLFSELDDPFRDRCGDNTE